MTGSHTRHQKVILTDNQPSSKIMATISRTSTTIVVTLMGMTVAATSTMNGQMLDTIKGIKIADTPEAMNLISEIVCLTM